MDGSGSISADEFAEMLKSINVEFNMRSFAMVLSSIDVCEDGLISLEEFHSLALPPHDMILKSHKSQRASIVGNISGIASIKDDSNINANTNTHSYIDNHNHTEGGVEMTAAGGGSGNAETGANVVNGNDIVLDAV